VNPRAPRGLYFTYSWLILHPQQALASFSHQLIYRRYRIPGAQKKRKVSPWPKTFRCTTRNAGGVLPWRQCGAPDPSGTRSLTRELRHYLRFLFLAFFFLAVFLLAFFFFLAALRFTFLLAFFFVDLRFAFFFAFLRFAITHHLLS
jgi:hypothetical protein